MTENTTPHVEHDHRAHTPNGLRPLKVRLNANQMSKRAAKREDRATFRQRTETALAILQGGINGALQGVMAVGKRAGILTMFAIGQTIVDIAFVVYIVEKL